MSNDPSFMGGMYHTPTVTLSNGLVVANFNSAHSFNFTDGSVLQACSEVRAKAFLLDQVSVEVPKGKWTGLKFAYRMSEALRNELFRLAALDNDVDLYLCPSAVMKAMQSDQDIQNIKAVNPGWDGPFSRFVGIKNADRVSKVIHHDIFIIDSL